MVRINYRFEVADCKRQGTARFATGRNPFLTGLIDGRDPWLLHSEQVPRWVAEHSRFLKAFSDDMKFEKRWPAWTKRSSATIGINGSRSNTVG